MNHSDAIYTAVDLLTRSADDLRQCHTLSTSPDDWTGEPEAKAEYDRTMACVAALQAQASGQAVVPQGWKFSVSHGDGRVWLRISTPHGACATLSVAEASEGGGPTIAAQVLDYLRDTLAAAPTPEPVAVGQRAGRDEFPMLYDNLDALDERAAEQPERIAVHRHLSSLRKSIQQVVQRLSLARARIADLESATSPAALDQPPTAPADEAIAEDWVTASDSDGIAYDGPSFEAGYRCGEVAERDRTPDALDQQAVRDAADAARYRAWREAATTDNRTFLEAANKYERLHFGGKSPSLAQFDAGIDYAIEAGRALKSTNGGDAK